MINIQISNKLSENHRQEFSFFTESSWANLNETFNNIPPAHFSAKKDETFVAVLNDVVHYFIGLGKDPQNFEIQATASKFSNDFRKKIQSQDTLLNMANLNEGQIKSIIEGLYLGTYNYPFKGDHPFFNLKFTLVSDALNEEDLQNLQQRTKALCEGQFTCMEWLNKPQNHKRIPQITQFFHSVAEKYGLKISVFDRQKCLELGLGAFLAVNQGSSQDAAFTVIEYNCGRTDAKTVGLVGKCVLFDTGGISIKNSENLHYMKSDMGGATAVIGTLISAAELKLPVNIIAVLPVTDNAVSNEAYLPSDVVKAYNGKTIEVLDTDAEGRMTLADGLSYLAKNYQTDALIDLATLTGSSVRMFGGTCAAYFSNNAELRQALEKSGDLTNQRLWNLPLWDVWKDEFKSDVADFKNISLKPYGDCIVAAKFLEQFIEEHASWAHLDIAGTAFGNVPYMKEKGATGYGVQLLVNFLENF
ncbi:Leucyl aminopeptidase [Flavobacteriaceae bacterium 3519-10]|nr:Leucyl aminopeptidase [Flavobacteriaceae bacterium 3519-10]